MTEEPKKPDDTWLGQTQADGWHMTEVTLPERPDQGPWRKAILWRLVEIAAAGGGIFILLRFIDQPYVVAALIVISSVIGVAQALMPTR
jgi:hypothetical protein